MATPTDVLWERDPHTAAKHTLLRRYLAAWFPIMANQFRREGITFLDGFAGPGEYVNSTESSPFIAMVQARRVAAITSGVQIRLVFIENDRRRAQHLRTLVERQCNPTTDQPAELITSVHHGKCGDLYEKAVADVGGWNGPVFANLDGWGVDTSYEIVRRIAKQQSSEVLVTFQDQFFIRFAEGDHEAGERVFGNSDWRHVSHHETHEKKRFLLDLYRRRLQDAGFTFVLTFEMVDEAGHSLHLFFGTTSEVAVQRFKDGLWEVDGVTGQKFRDPRDPNQLSFDILEPDFSPLSASIVALVSRSDRSMTELCRFALLETIYKPTHVKPVVDSLLAEHRLEKANWGKGYDNRVLRLAATLF